MAGKLALGLRPLRTTLLAAICCALGMVPTSVFAQSSQDIDASAEIAAAVTLIKTRDLDFGRIIVPRNGRMDLTSEADATCTTNNGLTHLGVCQSAAFEGSASQGFQLRIRVPANRRFNLTGPGQDLRVRRVDVGDTDGLQFLGRTGRNYDYIVTDANGDYAFHIGARLLFRNNQAPGVYSGTFTIEADYQ